MSTKTLRKRISLVAITALTAGVLSVATSPVASAANPTAGTLNASLQVATDASAQPTAALATAGSGTTATSKGLLYKDTTSALAQSAVVLTGGQLSLYATVSTAAAVSATGGSFSGSLTVSDTGTVETYNTANTATVFPFASTMSASTLIATLWTAPTIAGVYTVVW